MWDRPHVEVLHTTELAWVPIQPAGLPAGLAERRLSEDSGDGAVTSLVRIPAGWTAPGVFAVDATVEAFVVEGRLAEGGDDHPAGTYTYRPPRHPWEGLVAVEESQVLVMTDRHLEATEPDHDVVVDPRAIRRLHLDGVEPREPLTDKQGIGWHSRTLRLDPDTGERVFVTGFDVDVAGDPRIEWHDCVEEIYRLRGWGSLDHPDDTIVLAEGDYCFRPPGIPHGPFRIRGDSASLIRVSSTLVNHYPSDAEAVALWRDYGLERLDPLVRARAERMAAAVG